MSRPPVFPVEEKVRVVLSILAGEVSVAEAARRAKVSEQSVGNWKRQFLEAGRTGLAAGKSGPSTREGRSSEAALPSRPPSDGGLGHPRDGLAEHDVQAGRARGPGRARLRRVQDALRNVLGLVAHDGHRCVALDPLAKRRGVGTRMLSAWSSTAP